MPREASPASLNEHLATLGGMVDGWTREAVAENISPEVPRLAAMLEYHFGWRDEHLQPLDPPAPAGKRLRPALVLLVCQAISGDINTAARDAAVAVELIHNFSLVHDDIQDHSDLRRHRRTVWSLWGMPQGINAGDALFALAQRVVVREASALSASMAAELNATALLLAEGQFLDIDLQDGQASASLDAYETMIARKTGALFACACKLGAIAGGAEKSVQDVYAAYGLELGVAFQEQDDLLGVWGRASETGKPEAADIVERKRGLPAALALAAADAPAWLRSAYATTNGAADPQLVQRIIAHFELLDVQSVVAQRVEARYRTALEYLNVANPREPARGYLTAICAALVSRRT